MRFGLPNPCPNADTRPDIDPHIDVVPDHHTNTHFDVTSLPNPDSDLKPGSDKPGSDLNPGPLK